MLVGKAGFHKKWGLLGSLQSLRGARLFGIRLKCCSEGVEWRRFILRRGWQYYFVKKRHTRAEQMDGLAEYPREEWYTGLFGLSWLLRLSTLASHSDIAKNKFKHSEIVVCQLLWPKLKCLTNPLCKLVCEVSGNSQREQEGLKGGWQQLGALTLTVWTSPPPKNTRGVPKKAESPTKSEARPSVLDPLPFLGFPFLLCYSGLIFSRSSPLAWKSFEVVLKTPRKHSYFSAPGRGRWGARLLEELSRDCLYCFVLAWHSTRWLLFQTLLFTSFSGTKSIAVWSLGGVSAAQKGDFMGCFIGNLKEGKVQKNEQMRNNFQRCVGRNVLM